jgi:hypothetical protein
MQINLGKERFPFQYRNIRQINITQAQFIMVNWGMPTGDQAGVPAITLSSVSPPQSKSAAGGPTASPNATAFTILQPPQPSSQSGPKYWTLTYTGSLTNVVDVLLVCTFSIPAQQ